MRGRRIPQRELRNDVGRILREVEDGAEFTITVRGRPVARLGPVEPARRVDVDGRSLRAMLAATPVDEGLRADIEALRRAEAPVDDPWSDR